MRASRVLHALLPVMLGVALAQVLPLPPLAPTPAPDPTLEAALLAATNAARADAGRGALRADEGLARAARAHAEEMARLGYFSHSSPVAGHEDLGARLAAAGSPLLEVAENLALLGEPGDAAAAARRAVDGWLASPGHRVNLLNGAYDLVGFGTATGARGELVIVQDFGAAPAELLEATLVASARSVTEVRVTLEARQALSAVLGLGSASGRARSLPAGASEVVLSTEATGTVQLLAGVALSPGRYVVDDAGWLDLDGGGYRPDPTTPRASLTIASVSAHRQEQRGVRLALRYRPPEGAELALFLQGEHRPEARLGPGRFELFLPDTLGTVDVAVGVTTADGRVELLEGFHVDAAAPFPRLRAGAPSDAGP